MNRPIGIIGPIEQGKIWLEQSIDSSAQIYELDNTAPIDEIKDFRKMLMNQHIKQKIGVIYRINKFTSAKQAILLKIFEEMPEYNKCYFLASFLPTFTIITRSEIHYLKTEKNPELTKAKNFMINQMEAKTLTKKMKNAWKVLLKTQSLYDDSIINEQEKTLILKGLGIG